MALLNKFQAVNVNSGVLVTVEKVSENRFNGRWTMPNHAGHYEQFSFYYTEKEIQDQLLKGSLFIVNPVNIETEYKERPLPNKFFFTTRVGNRYTAYIQDDLVSVVWGEGMNANAVSYPLSIVKERIEQGVYTVLEESYRNVNTVAAEFMEFIKQQDKMETADLVALAQTVVLLNKVMYDAAAS